jgi:large subunit ribosomal protein L35
VGTGSNRRMLQGIRAAREGRSAKELTGRQIRIAQQALRGSQVRLVRRLVKCHNNWSSVMPKMKTKKSAAKRFVVRAGGTVKRGQAFKRHILTKKTTKTKRQLRGSANVHESNMNSVRAMMPYA